MRTAMRLGLIYTIFIIAATSSAAIAVTTTQQIDRGTADKGYSSRGWVEYKGERIAVIHMLPVNCYAKRSDLRRYARLVAAVKRVYPVAEEARKRMVDLEEQLAEMPSKKEQKAYVNNIYKELLEEYTPVLKRMTQTQGRILVRLIDRQTEYTAYEVVREFRGAFAASFWQGVGRMFGQDLKSEYGSSQEDQIIEQIIVAYEAGLI